MAGAAAEPSIEEACKAGCAAASKKCGNVSRACVNDCITRPALRACVTQPIRTCNALATCGMRAVCGTGVLRGTGTCQQALTCQLNGCSPGDVRCGCVCAIAMSPLHASALAAADACGINCGFDQTCMTQRCRLPAQTCWTQ